MPITGNRTKTRRCSRFGTVADSFSTKSRLYNFSIFVFCLSILTQLSLCTGSVGSNARAIQPIENLRNRLRQILLRQHDTTESFGFYYGIPSVVIQPLAGLKKLDNSGPDVNEIDHEDDISLAKQRYLEEYESIGRDVERWAEKMLSEGESVQNNHADRVGDRDGWEEVFCAKPLRSKFNSGKNNSVPMTRQWVKWMKDSRQQNADPSDNQKHPCMKLVATIDAPFPIVCRYLSEKDRFREYNSLLIDQEDVEILTPHSKICWSQSKKLLFIEPRDFVTYCRHRWLYDGTQLITNQACDHPRVSQDVSDGNADTLDRVSGFRAFSLRGATYISRCPDYPKKRTKLVLLSHCNCGRDVPEWAVRTAVGILAPIKPFEIIYRINKGIKKNREELEREEWKSISAPKTTEALDPERSSQPAGMAQMGYACFWPDGGGLVDEADCGAE